MPEKSKVQPKAGPKPMRVSFVSRAQARLPPSAKVIDIKRTKGGKSKVTITGGAEVYWAGDCRHLVDGLASGIAVHTGRHAGAARNPRDGQPHKQVAEIPAWRQRREVAKGATAPYEVSAMSKSGTPQMFARPRFWRTGNTAKGWLRGKIVGTQWSATCQVYPSNEVGARAAAARMLKSGYDLHTVHGYVDVLIRDVVGRFIEGAAGPKESITIPSQPPFLAERVASRPAGVHWLTIR